MVRSIHAFSDSISIRDATMTDVGHWSYLEHDIEEDDSEEDEYEQLPSKKRTRGKVVQRHPQRKKSKKSSPTTSPSSCCDMLFRLTDDDKDDEEPVKQEVVANQTPQQPTIKAANTITPSSSSLNEDRPGAEKNKLHNR